MANKRRLQDLSDDEDSKRVRTSSDGFGSIPSKSRVYDVDDFEVRDELFEIKDELGDEEPVVCEMPVEQDEHDPLEPLKDEDADEPVEADVKTEDDGLEGKGNRNFELAAPKQDYGGADLELEGMASKLYVSALRQPSTSSAGVEAERQMDASGRLLEPIPRAADTALKEEMVSIQDEPQEAISGPDPTDGPDEAKPCFESSKSVIFQLLAEPHREHLLLTCTEEQLNDIIRAGRPKPLMEKPSVGGFWADEADYKRITWLTGSESHLQYFCWPCLLFTKERWCLSGGETVEKFYEAVSHHRSNALHKVAEANLKLRKSELNDSPVVEHDLKDVVRKNRGFLTLLLRILVLKNTKLNNTDSNFDGYEELMKVAISHDPELQMCFRKQLSDDCLIDFVSRHAQKLLKSIKTRMAAKIFDEIKGIPFVSVIYEDTEKVVDKSTLVAVILRFVADSGDICERFVKFVKIGPSRNAYDVLEMHAAVLEEFALRDKLVGYTFSGTVIAPANIQEFVEILHKECPKASFFYHPDHNLKELLLQSLSHLEECQRFLEVVSHLVKFFWTNSGAIPTLVTFIKHSQPDCQGLDDPRSFTTNIISTFRRYYPLVVEFFFKVSEKFWNDEVAKHAPIFMKFLQEPSNRFLIAVIAAILDAVDDLSKALERSYDAKQWKSKANQVLETLNHLLEKGVKHFLNLDSNSQMLLNQGGLLKSCAGTFEEIIETAMNCVLHRVAKADTFYLNGKYGKVVEVLQAPDVWKRYGLEFASPEEFARRMEFFKVCTTAFAGKSIPDTIRAVANLERTPKFLLWWNFLRFCALAVSPPKSSVSSPSAVLRLRSYLKDKQEFHPTQVLMFLERALLRTQLKNSEFVDEVITHYAENNKEYNFLPDFSDIAKPVFFCE